jgi:hypothetical protein
LTEVDEPEENEDLLTDWKRRADVGWPGLPHFERKCVDPQKELPIELATFINAVKNRQRKTPAHLTMQVSLPQEVPKLTVLSVLPEW